MPEQQEAIDRTDRLIAIHVTLDCSRHQALSGSRTTATDGITIGREIDSKPGVITKNQEAINGID